MGPIRTRTGGRPLIRRQEARPPVNSRIVIPIETRFIPTHRAVPLMSIPTRMPVGMRRAAPLPPTNVPPPKMIRTVVLDSPDSDSLPKSSPDSGVSSEGQGCGANFAQRWLSRNQLIPRPKLEVRLDDRDEVIGEDEIMIVDNVSNDSSLGSLVDECGGNSTVAASDNQEEDREHGDGNDVEMCDVKEDIIQKSATAEASKDREVIDISDDDDASIICLEQHIVKQRPLSKRHVLNKNMEPTTSTPQVLVNHLIDGFSQDCHYAKRAVRQWVEANILDGLVKRSAVSTDLTICSYNVLCQKTISRTEYLYRHLNYSPKYLEWNYRWEGLKAELPRLDADILGLQEVQEDHFPMFYQPLMKQNGYDGFYTQKSGTAQKDDGCALFWRPAKFETLRLDSVIYFRGTDAVSNRENIGQVATLKCKTTGEVLIVANTHLLFNEERGDVKLAQLAILFANIHKIKTEVHKYIGRAAQPVIVIMGDFNIEPESKVYKFVTEGELLIDQVPIRTMSGQSFRCGGTLCNASKLLDYTEIDMNSVFLAQNCRRSKTEKHLRHPFDLVSAYHYNQATLTAWEKRPISTYHKDRATPDFIFYTPEEAEGIEKMQLLSRYSLPTVDTLAPVTPWPNEHVPSDHLPIIAKFRLSKLD